MELDYFVVDAFADAPFRGNPAGVCVLSRPLPPALMQSIAAENALPETAFLFRNGNGWSLRWFTPKDEIDLCGHGTLAAAYVVTEFLEPESRQLCFYTGCGSLTVSRDGQAFTMALPARAPEPVSLTAKQRRLAGCVPREALSSRDLFLVLDSARSVREYVPDYPRLRQLTGWLGVVVTAAGDGGTDFVSRYFCPELNAEDPVTGSSHCALVPYWSEVLGKRRLTARQLSPRGGTILCRWSKDAGTVLLSGQAVLYARGRLTIPSPERPE